MISIASNSQRNFLPGLMSVLSVVIGSCLILLAFSMWVDLRRLHLTLPSFNDQIPYISTTRSLLDTGTLENTVIYPSTLSQLTTKNYFYMPGHFYMLAASYYYLGFGVLQSMLPNLVSYVLASCAVYIIAARVYNTKVGFAAVILFWFFSPNLIYSFSAMSEMTRTAATVLAFAVFVYLPARAQIFFGPWLILIPFLFRETGALLILIMTIVVLTRQPPQRNVSMALLMVGLSLAVMGLVYVSDLSAGRPSLYQAIVFDGSFAAIHTDAVLQNSLSYRPANEWLVAIFEKLVRNSYGLFQCLTFGISSFQCYSLLPIVGVLTITGIYGFWLKDPFFLGVLAFGAMTLLVGIVVDYGYPLLRYMLPVVPFLVIASASLIDRYARPLAIALTLRVSRFPASLYILCLAIVLSLASLLSFHQFFAQAHENDRLADEAVDWIEQFGHDDSQMLVAPLEFISYPHYHYPVKWSFVPENRETFRLLAGRYEIGTLILPTSLHNDVFDDEFLAEMGLFPAENSFGHTEYMVFKRSIR